MQVPASWNQGLQGGTGIPSMTIGNRPVCKAGQAMPGKSLQGLTSLKVLRFHVAP